MKHNHFLMYIFYSSCYMNPAYIHCIPLSFSPTFLILPLISFHSLSVEHTLCLLTHAPWKHTHICTDKVDVTQSIFGAKLRQALWEYLSHFISIFTTLQRIRCLNSSLHTICSLFSTKDRCLDITFATQSANVAL